jgi:hemoglobin-like flavoprotein
MGNCSAICDHNYMPLEHKCDFPGYVADPIISKDILEICNDTWTQILEGKTNILIQKMSQKSSFSPITLFYDEFYNYLFKNTPDTKKFFEGGIEQRAESLIKMITISLNLVNSARTDQLLQSIAISHSKNKGIGPEHYAPVICALFNTLQELLGDSWNSKVETAWCLVYSYILNIMVPISSYHIKDATHNCKIEF